MKNDDVFRYKDSFVGDNGAVGNIANKLLAEEHLKGFRLQTKEEPYGITLDYDWEASEQTYKETAVYNATFMFALIQNVDWITFNYAGDKYTVTRADLEQWYDGADLRAIENEEELKKLTEEATKNKNINDVFN